MNSTLPFPALRVTSRGSRPNWFRAASCTASTSAPGFALTTGAYQKNHIVALQILRLGRELAKVADAFTHADLRMIQHGGDAHTGIAQERIAQVTKFPSRLGIHDQHLQYLLAHREMELPLIVVGKNF